MAHIDLCIRCLRGLGSLRHITSTDFGFKLPVERMLEGIEDANNGKAAVPLMDQFHAVPEDVLLATCPGLPS